MLRKLVFAINSNILILMTTTKHNHNKSSIETALLGVLMYIFLLGKLTDHILNMIFIA
jgi:hypothetical protein